MAAMTRVVSECAHEAQLKVADSSVVTTSGVPLARCASLRARPPSGAQKRAATTWASLQHDGLADAIVARALPGLLLARFRLHICRRIFYLTLQASLKASALNTMELEKTCSSLGSERKKAKLAAPKQILLRHQLNYITCSRLLIQWKHARR